MKNKTPQTQQVKELKEKQKLLKEKKDELLDLYIYNEEFNNEQVLLKDKLFNEIAELETWIDNTLLQTSFLGNEEQGELLNNKIKVQIGSHKETNNVIIVYQTYLDTKIKHKDIPINIGLNSLPENVEIEIIENKLKVDYKESENEK